MDVHLALMEAPNDLLWPNFHLFNLACKQHRPDHERQITGRTRTYMSRLYKISLKGGGRPNLAVPEIPGYGENVLNVAVPGIHSGIRFCSETEASSVGPF